MPPFSRRFRIELGLGSQSHSNGWGVHGDGGDKGGDLM